ncbi:hypothetical protein MMC11_008762 [Xylographa trunciseda]|nr:hypothetical protein [Xylographa trunciseda]
MSFLPAGFEDHQILREICEHIRLNIRGRRRKFNGLYVAVIGHILKVEPSEAFSWHQRLKDFPPDPEGQIELFDQTVASLPARQALLAIYADLPYPRIYSSIIPRLFARELYDDAISWHRMLLSRGDRPMSASVIEPLLEHLASSGNWKLSARVMAELVDAGVPFDATGNPIQEDIPVVSRQTMNEMHAKFYNFTPKRFSDEFCARLLATKMFSVRSVISGLQMLSVQAIGPLALREIALRTVHNEACRPDEMAIHLDQLHEAKIQLGSSTFSRLVERLVREKYDQLLYDVVISDQHPDVLEDNKLQESLLATHLRTGDKRQINRAIAVLTLDVKDEAIDTAYWNILFRCNLTLLDTSALLKTTEVMYVKGLPLTHMSRSYMWSKLMNPGELVHSTTKEHAQTLISIWQGFMIRGTIIPLTDWVKTLRRLGMTGQLKAYENLAFWLAKWYTDDRFGKSLIGTLNGADQLEASGKYSMPPTQTNSIHPLLILFPNYAQVTLLAWGFQMIKMTDLTSCMPSERVSKLAASDALWGLRMIARLRDFGINIDRATISRLCQTHLKRIFGLTRNSRNRDHHISVGSKGRWDEYVLAMEMIWGNDFFTKSSRIKGNTEQPSSAREPSLKTSAETFWSTEKKQNDAGMQRRLPSITSAVGAKQRSFLRINDSF